MILDLDRVYRQRQLPTRYNPSSPDAGQGRPGRRSPAARWRIPTSTWWSPVEQRLDNCPDVYNPIRPMPTATGSETPATPDRTPRTLRRQRPGRDPRPADNCPSRYNPDQRDSSGNNVGDACDEEVDDEPDAGGAGRDPDGAENPRQLPDTYIPAGGHRYHGIGDTCENVQDLATVDDGTDSLEIFIQSPPGNWPAPSSIHLGAGSSRGNRGRDLNQDSYVDLVVSNTEIPPSAS